MEIIIKIEDKNKVNVTSPGMVSASTHKHLREAAEKLLTQLTVEESNGYFKDHTEGWNDVVDALHAELYG